MNADYITIGANLSDLYNIYRDNEYYEELGERFCNFIKDKNARRVLKKINFDLLGMEIFFFGMDVEELKYTQPILIRRDKAQFKIRIINGELMNPNNEPFYIRDMFEICHHFIVISEFESMALNAGKILLNWILRQIPVPILLQAGYLYYGEYETRDEKLSVLNKNCKFYEELGFVDINKWLGCYSESRTMIKAEEEVVQNLVKHFK